MKPLYLEIDSIYSSRARYSPSAKPIWHQSQEGDPYYIGKRYSDDLMEIVSQRLGHPPLGRSHWIVSFTLKATGPAYPSRRTPLRV